MTVMNTVSEVVYSLSSMFTYDYAFVDYIIVVLYDVYHDNVRHGFKWKLRFTIVYYVCESSSYLCRNCTRSTLL